MNFSDFLRYQSESQARANLPPVAKHSKKENKQPEGAST